MSKIERIWTDVDGVAVHARHHRGPRDAGEPIVLVHGLGMSSRYMMPLLRRLSTRFEVYAVDLPGYGRSENPSDMLHLHQLASAVDRWMAAVGIEHAVVGGNSLGAQVVAHLAVRHPGRVSRAILIGATRDPHSGGPWQHVARLLLDGLRERPALIAVAVRDYVRAGPIRMFSLMREAIRAAEESDLARVSVPTLVVRGGRDPISTQAWNETVQGLIPHARMVTVPGAGHALNFSAPDALAAAIVEFCAAESPGAGAAP